jgi:ATP-dependent 26S proteasome regulatory subunit
MTRSQKIAAELTHCFRARHPLLWIITREEARVERYIHEAAANAAYITRSWDVAQGVTEIGGKPPARAIGSKDPGEMLDAIMARAMTETGPERAVWIMRDLPAWLVGPSGIVTLRQLRNLARALPGRPRDSAQALVVISPSGEVPPELASHATVIEWPLPDREEIAAILDAAIGALPEDIKASAAPNGTRDAAIDAAIGLSGEEAAACYAKSLVQLRRIDVATVANEKKRVIARERVLEWVEPIEAGMDAVGGLENLKQWLLVRGTAYSAKARAYGLPSPRGILLGGISGCGKSLTPKALAKAWKCPLLRLDMGALKSKFVGESETNLRKALKVAEATGKCILWIDEIEKALQGATSGASDGGVSSDALGALLSWMQERTSETFIVATANDVSILPPELLRRFDKTWWIDLPTLVERTDILAAALRVHKRGDVLEYSDWSKVAAACPGFTGVEVADLVPAALFAAFSEDGREIETADLLEAIKFVSPLSVTAKEKIESLRQWGRTRAQPASAVAQVETVSIGGRALDF